MLLGDIAVGYASLLSGLTKAENTFSTLDGSVDDDNYLPEKNNGMLVDNWYQGMKVCFIFRYLVWCSSDWGALHVWILWESAGARSLLHEHRGISHRAPTRTSRYATSYWSIYLPHTGVSYYILTLLASTPSNFDVSECDSLLPAAIPAATERVLEQVKEAYKVVDIWATFSVNFRHYGILIKAEVARVRGYVSILSSNFFSNTETFTKQRISRNFVTLADFSVF